MILATDRRMTLREFLTYDDGTMTRYELVDGVLVDMGAESTANNWIAIFFIEIFLMMGSGRRRIGIKQYLEVPSPWVTARDPDLIIHSEESAQAIAGRSEVCLELGDPNPLLIIEVASPGPESSPNYKRDYQQKPTEYAARGITEYWIIDPNREVVRVGILLGHEYQFTRYCGDEQIRSLSFPALNLTAQQILEGGQ